MDEPEEGAPKGDRVSLGGRIYRVMRRRAKQTFWVAGQAQRAGLFDLSRRAGESMSTFTLRLQGELSASGAAHILLGGLLIREHLEDKDWTPKLAEETGAFIGELDSDEDMETISHLFGSFIIGFFATGMASLGSSDISSIEPAEDGGHPSSNGKKTTMASGVS